MIIHLVNIFKEEGSIMNDKEFIKNRDEKFDQIKSLKEEYDNIDVKMNKLIDKAKSGEKISKEEYDKMVEYDKKLREILNKQQEIRKQILEIIEMHEGDQNG
jgi:uncharacterized coiled-coil DUF342 family protein